MIFHTFDRVSIFLKNPTVLQKNILANFFGQGWIALINIAIIPTYIRFLGIEAYGVVGLYATLFGFFSLFDLGLTSTITRELARYSAQKEKSGEMRDFVHSLELSYWVIGLLLSIVIILLAPLIANYWINAQNIPTSVISKSIMIMGILSFFQWPMSFYQGGLMGLQKQVLINVTNAGFITLKSISCVFGLWLVSPTIIIFFLTQLIFSVLHIILTMMLLWKNLPKTDQKPKFRIKLLGRVWKYAFGVSFTSLNTLLRKQIDKIILSKMVSLELFGYYILATNIGNALSMVTTPIFHAIFPHLTALVEKEELQPVKEFYHHSCQLVALMIIPSSIVVALFSFELVSLWTWNTDTARIVSPILSVFAVGTMLNSLAGMPYSIQLAFGWTNLAVYKAIISFIVIVPSLYIFTKLFGPVGAGLSWVLLNLGFVFIEVPIMHRRLLKGEMRRWYIYDVGTPVLFTTLFILLIRSVITRMELSLAILPVLIVVSVLSLIVVALSLPYFRKQIYAFLRIGRI